MSEQYSASITVPTKAHDVRPEDLEAARNKFAELLTKDNVNIGSNPTYVVSKTLDVGHALTVQFAVDLPDEEAPVEETASGKAKVPRQRHGHGE